MIKNEYVIHIIYRLPTIFMDASSLIVLNEKYCVFIFILLRERGCVRKTYVAIEIS
jgi:hypothetical protein